jgi:hypothetical protein
VNIQAALVLAVLEHWQNYEWTVQGFGMVRTKLGKDGRIHIWDSRLRTPLVSDVHEHPWPLHSTIISGELINQRFQRVEVASDEQSDEGKLPYYVQDLRTGEGGHLVEDTCAACFLVAEEPEFYLPGESYSQAPREIHRTQAQDGTVTLLERPMGSPLEETRVYWPQGLQWVSAEPRPPKSAQELEPIIRTALARWHAGD